MEKTAIVTDSNSGLTPEVAAASEIRVIPMLFTLDGREYREGISLTEEKFFKSMRNGSSVSTSQLPMTDLTDLWDELLKTYDKVIHIPMSKALSGGYATAVMLAEEYDGKVLVIDSQRISVTQASMALEAARLARSGLTALEIKEKLNETALEASIYITVESLEYLKKGGRISAAAAMAGELLNIKPVLEIKGGLLEVYGKVRGHKKAKKTMEEALLEDWKRLSAKYGQEKTQLYVGHADAEQEAMELADTLKEIFPGCTITIASLPMSICCHVGPGTIGVAVCV